MTRRDPMFVTGIEAVILLAMRESWAAGDGRADAALEMLRTCVNTPNVVPRVRQVSAVKPRPTFAEPESPTASAAFGDLGLTVGQWTQVRDRALRWPDVRRRAS